MQENSGFFNHVKEYFTRDVPKPVSAARKGGPLLNPMNLTNQDIYEDYYLAQFLPNRAEHSNEQHHPAVPK